MNDLTNEISGAAPLVPSAPAKLTPKQEAFAVAVAGGASKKDAYKVAYNALQMADATIYVRASELAKHPAVAARIAELTQFIEDETIASRREILETVTRVLRTSKYAKDKIAAAEALYRMQGLEPPKEVRHLHAHFDARKGRRILEEIIAEEVSEKDLELWKPNEN